MPSDPFDIRAQGDVREIDPPGSVPA